MASALKNLASNGDLSDAPNCQWLADLLSSRTQLELRLMNIAGRLRMPPQWSLTSQGLSEHLFYLVAEGGFEAHVDDREIQLSAGDLIWIGPGMPFSF